jgi:hypothetical protein
VAAFSKMCYDHLKNTSRWAEIDFVTSFTALLAHLCHNRRVKAAVGNFENENLVE